ncbi:MAG TPA: nicotinate-nucleotide adenylyltransferase [Edaphobacter sp.]|nr:nicotinate-nucleotide adenylyltransferase [Edaphobacter sp.]
MRIALFGGTFDPPHRGHLAIATAAAAADAFQLDSVLFAPAGRQPLKLNDNPSTFADRLAMTTLACAETEDERFHGSARFHASAIDAPRRDGQPNYTADTLAELQQSMPNAVLYNLVGADSFLSLPHWRDPARLLALAEWIVVSRPGFSLADLSALALTDAQRSRVHLLETVHEEVSATRLRERLRSGDPCTDLLPAAVADYIRTHRLYL